MAAPVASHAVAALACPCARAWLCARACTCTRACPCASALPLHAPIHVVTSMQAMQGPRYAMLLHLAMMLSKVSGGGLPSDGKAHDSPLSSHESAITGEVDGARDRRRLASSCDGWYVSPPRARASLPCLPCHSALSSPPNASPRALLSASNDGCDSNCDGFLSASGCDESCDSSCDYGCNSGCSTCSYG
eukprot:scaffold33572_cov47-Phaeocystis_antarctica.AAC.4